jgi:hypothetical protein
MSSPSVWIQIPSPVRVNAPGNSQVLFMTHFMAIMEEFVLKVETHRAKVFFSVLPCCMLFSKQEKTVLIR